MYSAYECQSTTVAPGMGAANGLLRRQPHHIPTSGPYAGFKVFDHIPSVGTHVELNVSRENGGARSGSNSYVLYGFGGVQYGSSERINILLNWIASAILYFISSLMSR